MNIKNALNYGQKILNSFNINNSILDSELLLAKVIKKNRQYIILNLKKNIGNNSLKLFFKLIKRKKKRRTNCIFN